MVRDFDAADQVAVHDLVLQGLRERWGDAFDPSFNQDLDDIDAHYVEAGADVVVAEHAGAVVACGILLYEGDEEGRLVRVSVASTHRRRGLARAVVAELVERAHQRGRSRIHVLTDTPWTSAVELYRACGFTQLDSDGTDTHFVLDLGAVRAPSR